MSSPMSNTRRWKQAALVLPPEVSAASVRGALHESEGLPNQDAWSSARGTFGVVLIACDGLGSRAISHIGARAACRAVRTAVKEVHVGRVPRARVCERVEKLWGAFLGKAPPADAATTCRFVWLRPDGRLLAAARGDGLTVLVSRGRPARLLVTTADDSFANLTEALGGSGSWTKQEMPCAGPATIMIATDGVSGDLRVNRVGEFATWLASRLGTKSETARRSIVRRLLLKWPVEKHFDDKTLCVLSSFGRWIA